MSKALYRLTTTLKAGEKVWPKGQEFTDETLPEELVIEVEREERTIEVINHGIEDSDFKVPKTVKSSGVKKPKTLLKTKKT